MNYLKVASIFFALGVFLFLICQWWYAYLVALARNYDVPERRKRAAHKYYFVMFLVAAPAFGVILGAIRMFPKTPIIVLIGFILSIAPGMTWWFLRMPHLYSLGYGRQRK